MDFYNHLRSFFGLPSRHFNDETRTSDRFIEDNLDEEDEDQPHHSPEFFDPFEMHRHFEQQFSNIMKGFGLFDFANRGSFFAIEDPSNFFQGEGFDYHQPQVPEGGELRDQFLKPGFVRPQTKDRQDDDIDGKLDVRSLDSILGRNEKQAQFNPQRRSFFGQSVTSKTVMRNDGIMETRRTITDSQGNKEITITRKIGDKEHTIIKKIDKEGREETVENLINMDEKEVEDVFRVQPLPESRHAPNWFPFDKFFK